MQRQKIIIISGVILALLAVLMVKVYLDQRGRELEQKARQSLEKMQANQVPVLVAKSEIPSGSTIEPDSFEVQVVPNQYIAPQAVTSLDRIAGMITIAPISKGEQITMSKLMYTRQTGSLAGVTPIGKRAITISVDSIASLGGMVRPGDYVDVIVIIPVPVETPDGKRGMDTKVIPLFQNVLVLAVGQELGIAVARQESRYRQEGQKEVSSPLITLALTPQEANFMAYVQEQGKIRLAMRNPADTKAESAQSTGWETLFGYVMPQQMQSAKEQPEPPSDYVEIYRGLKKEKMPLSK